MSALTYTSKKIKKTRADAIFDVFNLMIWIIILLIVLYPLWLILISSISDPDMVLSGQVLLIPKGISMIGYTAVFQHQELWNSYLNSIIYTVGGTAVSIVVTMMASYALTRKFAGKKIINFFFVFTMFFSGGLIPTFLLMRDLGFYNTRFLMIAINCVNIWNLMVARTYIKTTLPDELYEAAILDGATHFRYFLSVVLPLSGTIVAVLTVYYAVGRWNDYFTALVYIKDRELLPLQTILREILATLQSSASADAFFESGSTDLADTIRKAQVAKYCCIVVSTVPAVVLYIFMQKYFVKGVMIGSLKG